MFQSKKPIQLLVVDIDGTIADIRFRAKKAGSCPSRRNRRAFQIWLDRLQPAKSLLRDKPLYPVVSLVYTYVRHMHTEIVYLTGRAEKYRKITELWLSQHKLLIGPVYMRANDDWRSAAQYKQSVMKELCKRVSVSSAILVLDDDADGDCSHMYTKLGCVHLKVCV